jgi:coproporphyrinogen III oxidase-like Fe-S oxidoreductase
MATEATIPMQPNPLPTLLKFDRQLPVYNWYYPFETKECELADPFAVYTLIDPHPRRRALYFHIPFCETICSFCPFVRGAFSDEDELSRYVRALLREIAIKHEYPAFSQPPVDTIYFGGGSPSVLHVEHIYQLGEALHRFFDLSQLQEFTWECEVKSIALEKIKALRAIGVNRISFGVQTFNPVYRELFALTATVAQIRQAAEWLNEHFAYTNADLIYGMAGQTLDDFLTDVDRACELETTTVDYYPLNNVAAQLRLHQAFATHNLRPLSASTKMSYRMFLNEYLRAQGYVPINGYSFMRRPATAGHERVVVCRDRVFRYHDIVYGYSDEHTDAYGAGAFGHYGPCSIRNIYNREQYMERLLANQRQPWFYSYSGLDAAEQGIVYFPYRGSLDKSRIAWEQIHPETRATLDESVACGLAIDCGDRYEITEAGWLCYVNYMYALMPRTAQEKLATMIAHSSVRDGRQPDDQLLYPRKAAASTQAVA